MLITPCLKKPLLYNSIVRVFSINGRDITNIYHKKTMNKQAIVEMVHAKLGGTKVQAEEIVDGIFDSIVATMKKGGEVSVAGFGIFSVKARAARMARNPKTGEQVKVAAKKVPKFRAAKALKDAVE